MSGVVAGNSGASLPGRLREEETGSAARGGGRAVKRAIVPGRLGYVGKCRSAIRIVGRIPICRATFLKLRAANSGDLRNTGGSIHKKPTILRVIANRGAPVRGGCETRDGLGGSVVGPRSERQSVGNTGGSCRAASG